MDPTAKVVRRPSLLPPHQGDDQHAGEWLDATIAFGSRTDSKAHMHEEPAICSSFCGRATDSEI